MRGTDWALESAPTAPQGVAGDLQRRLAVLNRRAPTDTSTEMATDLSANPRREPPAFVVLGSCIVDFCVRVDRLPARGETVLASSVTRSLGGKGANQATALRR